MNKIEINFTPCEPAPPGGYNVKWWVAGSDAAPKNAGNFFINPAVFYDTLNPTGTEYEGFIKSECGGVSNQIYWNTTDGCGESGADNLIAGTIENTAHGIYVTIEQAIPCDVTFPLHGFYDDGGEFGFSANVTVPAGALSGSNLTAIPSGVIDCITPNVAPNIFHYSILCDGVNYIFDLIIDSPC
jgi:hypothetical protein